MASIIRRTLVHAVRRYSQISYQLKPKTFLPKLSNYNVKFYESTGILSDYSLALRREFCTYNIRRYSTVVGKDPEAKVKSAESNDLMVVEYAENSKQFYRVNFEEMTKLEIISYFSKREGLLEAKLEAPKKEVELKYIPWYKSLFVRDYASQTYDESSSIDFHEESHSDYHAHVPLSEYNKLYERAVKAVSSAVKAETELKSRDAMIRSLVVPLSVRNKAVMIERRFPTIKGIPSNIPGLKAEERSILWRVSIWKQILSHRNDLYVSKIVEGLENSFKAKKNIDRIEPKDVQEFEGFVDHFCESIARSIHATDELVAHFEFRDLEKTEKLNVFDGAINEYVTLFYNSVVAHSKKW